MPKSPLMPKRSTSPRRLASGKSQGLRDDLAKPEGVFLFRYESNAIVRALDEPIATGAQRGMYPSYTRRKIC
jgi:hypothetical protein